MATEHSSQVKMDPDLLFIDVCMRRTELNTDVFLKVD